MGANVSTGNNTNDTNTSSANSSTGIASATSPSNETTNSTTSMTNATPNETNNTSQSTYSQSSRRALEEIIMAERALSESNSTNTAVSTIGDSTAANCNTSYTEVFFLYVDGYACSTTAGNYKYMHQYGLAILNEALNDINAHE